jgi:hypothetical protein
MPHNLIKSSSHSSLQSTASATSVSGTNAIDHGVKRFKDAADITAIPRPLKRSKPALSGLSSPAISDLDDDPTVAEDLVSNKTCTSEVIEIDSDRDELEKELGKCSLIILSHCCSYPFLAAAQKTWRSPIYGFFKPNVAIEIHKGRVSHFFRCAAKRCKTEARGVRRYQDKGDKSSTANLRHHAIRCFGEAAINVTDSGSGTSPSGNIFNAFARQGQQPVTFSHRSHTNSELRYVVLFWACAIC